MQRSAIRTEVRRILNDLNTVLFTDAMINSWIDLGVVDAGTYLELDTAVATISTVTSEQNYQLPSNAMSIKDAYLQDQADRQTRLKVVSQDELNDLYGNQWREEPAGAPIALFQADYNVVGLYPATNAANASNTLRVFYVRIPSNLASDTDTPIFMDALHDAVSWYCASRGYALLGNPDKSDWALKRYQALLSKFMSIATRFSDDMRRFRW